MRIEPFDLVGMFTAIWRGKWVVIFTMFIAGLVAGYYAFAIATPQFAATATIQVELGRAQIPETTGNSIDPARLNTQAAILRSRHLLAQVVDDLDLTHDPTFNRYLTPIAPWSITGLRNQLRTAFSGATATPPTAATILDKTIENLAAALTTGPERGTYIFAVTAVTPSAAQSTLIANTLASAYLLDQNIARQMENETTVQGLGERVGALQVELQSKETAINTLLTTGQMQDGAQLDALNSQALETDQRLGELRNALAVSPRSPNAIHAQIVALESFRDGLRSQITQQSAGLVQLQQLRREAESTRTLYTTLLAQLQEMQSGHGSNGTAGRILSPASPGRYVAPRKMLILLIALLTGASVGIALVLIRHSRVAASDTLTTRTGLPVLARLPRISARTLKTFAGAKAQQCDNAVNQLRTALLLRENTRTAQVVVTTTVNRHQKTPTVTLALARSLGRLGKTVLVIDANTQCTKLSQLIGQSHPVSLEQVMTRQVAITDAVVWSSAIKADILCAPPADQHITDAISSPQFAQMIAHARTIYDYIVIDAPAVLGGPDTAIIAQCADAVLCVVMDRKTLLSEIIKGRDALAAVGTPLTGAVMM